ncbi:MAG: hypothetical protein ACP5XB_32120 [Isosphaeraceae bacterium]
MKSGYRQVVRLAQPVELKAYVVFEHQLDLLSQGSPASLLLNFALFFLGVAATALGTLVTAAPDQDRVFYTFFIVFVMTLIAGIVLLAIWFVTHKSVKTLVLEIKAQMPANPAVEQVAPEAPDTGGERVHTRP